MTPQLYAVVCINRKTKREHVRLDLAPMNHAAACNWMDACRTEHTDYRLTDWPESVPHPKPPLFSDNYKKEKSK